MDCSVPPVYGEERGGLVNRAFLVPHQSTATWKGSREPFVLMKERDIPLILGKLCTMRRGPCQQHHRAAMAHVWGGSPVMAKPPRKRLLSCPQSRSTAKPPHFLSHPHPSELRPAWRPLHRAEDLGVFHRLLTLPSFPPRVPSPRDRSHAIWGDEAPIRSVPHRQKGKAPCGLLAASRLPWDTRSQTQHLEPHQELGCSFLVARGGLEMFSGKTSSLVYPAPFPQSLCRQTGNSVQGQLKKGV